MLFIGTMVYYEITMCRYAVRYYCTSRSSPSATFYISFTNTCTCRMLLFRQICLRQNDAQLSVTTLES